MDRFVVGQGDWLFGKLVECRWSIWGVGRGLEVGGGVQGSVTDSHLVSMARAARVVPPSAVVFDGMSRLSNFYLKSGQS